MTKKCVIPIATFKTTLILMAIFNLGRSAMHIRLSDEEFAPTSHLCKQELFYFRTHILSNQEAFIEDAYLEDISRITEMKNSCKSIDFRTLRRVMDDTIGKLYCQQCLNKMFQFIIFKAVDKKTRPEKVIEMMNPIFEQCNNNV